MNIYLFLGKENRRKKEEILSTMYKDPKKKMKMTL